MVFFLSHRLLEALERARQLRVVEVVAEQLKAVAQRGAPGVFAQHDAVGGQADLLRLHDLVGAPILQHAVLVDAGLVRERVAPDDRLVGLHVEAGDLADQAAGRVQVLGVRRAWSPGTAAGAP